MPNFDSPSVFARILDKDKVYTIQTASPSSLHYNYIREGISASHQPYHLRPSRLTCQAQMYVVIFLQTHDIVSNMWLRYYKPSMSIKRRPPVVFSKHSF